MKTAEINTNLGKFGWRIEVFDRIDVELLAEMKMQEAAFLLRAGVPYAGSTERTSKQVWDLLLKGNRAI